MRTVLLYVPALICAGSMFVCVRMMSGKHDSSTAAEPKTRKSSKKEPEPSALTDS